MLEPEFKLDTRAFESALREYIKVSSRTAVEVVNGAAIEVIKQASRTTKVADRARIEKALIANVQVITHSAKTGKQFKTARKSVQYSLLVYRIVNARQRKNALPELAGSAMAAAAKRLIGRRMSAVGYIAKAGWMKALSGLGGGSGGVRVNPKSFAARGTGRKATEHMIYAYMSNTATGADKVAAGPFQAAIHAKAENMLRRAHDKIMDKGRELIG